MSPLRVRILASMAALVSFLILSVGLLSLYERVGTTWSGLPLSVNAYLGPDILIPENLHQATAGLVYSDRIVEVDGYPVVTGAEVQALVGRRAAGQRVIYGIETTSGIRSEIDLPVQLLDADYVRSVFLPLVLIGIAFLVFSTIPVMARPELPLARAVFALALGVVTFANFSLVDIFLTYVIAPWSFMFATFFTAGMFHFSMLFPEERWPHSAYPVPTAVGLYGGMALFWSFFIFATLHQPDWVPLLRGVAVAMVVVAAGCLIANLVDAAWRSEEPRIRRLARLGLTAPIMWLAGVLSIFLTSYGVIDTYVPPIAQLLPGAILVFCAFYGTVVDNAFEIDEVARRLIAFFAVGLVAVSAYLVLLGLLSLFLGTVGAFTGASLAAILLVCLAPVVPAVHVRVEDFVEAALFPARRRAREAIERAAREIGSHRRPQDLVSFLCETLGDAIPCSSVRVVIGARGEPMTEVAPPAGRIGLRLPTEDALYMALEMGSSVSQEARLTGRRRLPQGAIARSRDLGAHLVVALTPSESVIGGILLGERDDGQLYTAQDEHLIEMIARQAAVALENAAFWEEIETLRQRLEKENLYLREQAAVEMQVGDIVGRSAGVIELVNQIRQVAATDASVLLIGETGTGKELAVRALHGLSPRSEGPLAQVACAALPENLLESELFGHEKGAFSGADSLRVGRIEAADGGTFFFDDVDTLPLGVQAKLLRALQEGEVQRLGSNDVRQVDVRIVASTNRDLLTEVREGRFREDLYYRLAVVPIRLPPLRERREDIPLLAEHFVSVESVRLGCHVRGISVEMMEALENYSWPGNIRELRNVIERALVLATDDVLRLPGPLETAASVPSGESVSAARDEELGTASLAELMRRYKTHLVKAALSRSGGNQRRAAEILGMHRPSLTRMIRDLGLRGEPD
ncbi:sigma 54-interacting transcriptional regulator [Myxococcota bacterium]|nr:sigma 54-interacting transcriptional regulator [Myxococcota bacterium]